MSELRTNRIVPRDGLPAGSSGGIIQIAYTQKTNDFECTSTSYVDITGMSCAITPQSASNKILVRVHMTVVDTGSPDTAATFRLVRGSTVIGSDTGDDRNGIALYYTGSSEGMQTVNFEYLDSPATTSATTYKVTMRGDSTDEVKINYWPNNNQYRGTSSITLMEVSG